MCVGCEGRTRPQASREGVKIASRKCARCIGTINAVHGDDQQRVKDFVGLSFDERGGGMGRVFEIREVVPGEAGGGGGGFAGCFTMFALLVAVFGVGRCLGCDWAKSTAEKSIGKELGWGVEADLDIGRYQFVCPPGGTPGEVYGTEIYDAKSSICGAAVHSGAITLETGGGVSIEVLEKVGTVFAGSSRNGVTSRDGKYSLDRRKSHSKADAGPPDWKDKVFVIVR